MTYKNKYHVMGGIAFILLGLKNLVYLCKGAIDRHYLNFSVNFFFWEGVEFFILGYTLLMIGVLFLISDIEEPFCRGKNE